MRPKHVFFVLIQLTWGILQTAAGAVLFVLFPGKTASVRGSAVRYWRFRSSVSLGLFIFIASEQKENEKLFLHEYGHFYQSLILGPLYLFVIGVPSFIWGNLPSLRKKRSERNIPYSRFYTERTAESLSERFPR